MVPQMSSINLCEIKLRIKFVVKSVSHSCVYPHYETYKEASVMVYDFETDHSSSF